MALDYTYMFTGSSVFIHSEGKSWLVASTDSKYEKVAELIKKQASFEKLKEVLEVDEKENLRQWCSDQLKGNKAGISIGESTVEIDGEPVYGGLCKQIIAMHKEEMPLEPLVNFVRKMRQNPSYRIRQQLWGFIEACQSEGGFTLHNDGDIMAYKVVSENFKDCHSGTFDNHPGCIVEMPREEVDDDPSHTCSAGLHFCAYSYVKSFSSFGTKLVLVKVNPKDVVSIPEDYGNAKARCCRYEVVEEIDSPLRKTVYEDGRHFNEEGLGVYRMEWHDVDGDSMCFTFKDPETDGHAGYTVGDVVEAYFPDYYDKDYHIGVLLEKDEEDEDLTWQVGFFDHYNEEWTEWWVNEDHIHYPSREDAEAEEDEWFSRFDRCVFDDEDADDENESAAFSIGDAVRIPMLDGKVGIVSGIEKAASANGETMYYVRWTEDDGSKACGYLIEELLEPADACNKAKDEDASVDVLDELEDALRKMCRKSGINYDHIKSLAEDLADTVLNEKKGDDGNAEFFIETWLNDAGRKKTAKFLESRCKKLMDGSLEMRLALSGKEFNPSKVKRLLGDWMKKQLDCTDDDEERIWKAIRTLMRSWDKFEN